MARIYAIETHQRRAEIDFSISQKLPFTIIAEHYGIDRRTISAYARRMVASERRYFARLRIGTRLPPHQAFLAASIFAEHSRAELVRAAESAFHPI